MVHGNMERDLLWCEDCKRSLPGDCEQHGALQHVADRPVSPRAVKTAPRLIEIAPITPHETGDSSDCAAVGAFATCSIPSRTCFGPFEAATVSAPPHVGRTRLLLKRFRSGKACGYLDVSNDYACNWLIYVRPAHGEAQINVVAFLYKDEIYYCTSRIIAAREELRVWYSEEYAHLMGSQPLSDMTWLKLAYSDVSLPVADEQLEDQQSPRSTGESVLNCQMDDRLPGRRKALRPQRIEQSTGTTKTSSELLSENAADSAASTLPPLPDREQDFITVEESSFNSPRSDEQSVLWSSHVFSDSHDMMSPKQLHGHAVEYDDDEESEFASESIRSSLDSEQDATSQRPRSCSDCGECFSSLDSMHTHAKLHTGGRPHVCSFPFCRKVFTSKYKLLRHELIHSQEKRHHCPLCHKKFHRKDHLSNHLKVHERSKVRLECHLCGCVFAKKWTYEKHMALHEGYVLQNGGGSIGLAGQGQGDLEVNVGVRESADALDDGYVSFQPEVKSVPTSQKPSHPCDVCGKVFSASKDLRRHLQTHLGVKPNLCPFCPKKFTRKDHVRRHVTTVHAAEYNSTKNGM